MFVGGLATAEKWDQAKALAMRGEIENITSDLYIRFYNTFKNIAKDHMVQPADIMDGSIGYWYYGKTGRGKTFAAINDFPNAYRKTSNNKWWDGYAGQENVMIDDLDKSHHYMGYHLKIWGDRYAFIAETKGSSQYIRPEHVCVTSNYHPRDIWDDASTLEPILRRFKIIEFVFDGDFSTHNDDLHEVRRRDRQGPPPGPFVAGFTIPAPILGPLPEPIENPDGTPGWQQDLDAFLNEL